MVSGFLTSPCDHDRIISGDAIEIRIALNAIGFLGFSNRPKRSSIVLNTPRPLASRRRFQELDVETQRLEFLDHYVKRLGQPGLQRVLALDDCLVQPCS